MDLISIFDNKSYIKCLACKRNIPMDNFYVKDGNVGICNFCHARLPFVPIGTTYTEDDSHIELTMSVFFYSTPIKNVIKDFKFKRCKDYGVILGKYMADYIISMLSSEMEIDAIVPVPLSPRSMQERKYNQAEILSRTISEESGIMHIPDALTRAHSTINQSSLPPWKRAEYLRRLFSVSNPNISGKNILLVDDVYTTGNTVRACAETLYDAGARSIHAYTLARRFNLNKSTEYNQLLES